MKEKNHAPSDRATPQKEQAAKPVSARDARLKAALKTNMAKRKLQARARAIPDLTKDFGRELETPAAEGLAGHDDASGRGENSSET